MGNYDKLTDSIAAGQHAMHDCMGVYCTRTRSQLEHLHHRNLQQHTTEIQVLVHITASNHWRRDLAAFDNMVLSSSVSRLPWRRDGTISLPRLASNITVPSFGYNNMFLFRHQSCLVFWKIKFFESKCHQCYLKLCLCISSETFLEEKWW